MKLARFFGSAFWQCFVVFIGELTQLSASAQSFRVDFYGISETYVFIERLLSAK